MSIISDLEKEFDVKKIRKDKYLNQYFNTDFISGFRLFKVFSGIKAEIDYCEKTKLELYTEIKKQDDKILELDLSRNLVEKLLGE